MAAISTGNYDDFQPPSEHRSWANQEGRSWVDRAEAAGPVPAQLLERRPLGDRDSDSHLEGPYEKPKYGRPWCGIQGVMSTLGTVVVQRKVAERCWC